MPQPCSEREGGVAPGSWGEGVLCKRPSGSVWFRAVTPLPVSLRHTVTTVASARRGPVKAGVYPVEKSQPHLRAVRGSTQSKLPEPRGLWETSDVRPPGQREPAPSASRHQHSRSICHVASAAGPWGAPGVNQSRHPRGLGHVGRESPWGTVPRCHLHGSLVLAPALITLGMVFATSGTHL